MIQTLLIGVCVCGAIGAVLQLEQRRPVMELERAGAAVVDAHGSPRTVSFCSPAAGDAHLRLIARLPTVTSVNLARSNVTAEGIRQLAALPRLEMLDLSETPHAAGVLEVVAGFPALRMLQLRRCPWLNDEELAALVRASSLESLMISEANITDAGLQHLSQCTRLTQVGIDRCSRVTDAGIRRLARGPILQNVSINECAHLTEASVLALTDRNSLTTLSASGIPMSRKVLRSVTRNHPLTTLTLDRFEFPEWQPLLDAGARIGLDASYELKWIELDDRWHDPKAAPPYTLSSEPEREQDALSAERGSQALTVADDLLQCLAAAPDLPRLYLRNLPISNDQLAGLRCLPQLQILSLENVPITDAGLQALSDHEALEALWLLRVPVNGQGVSALAGLPKLKELALLSDQVTQAGVEAVARLKSLESLAIGDVSSASIGTGLGEMPNLTRLALVRANLTAEDVTQLCASPRLEELELLRASLVGDAFAPMIDMTALQTIYLARCEFDRGALRRLIDRRPDLQVDGAAGISRRSPPAEMMPQRRRLLGGIPLFIPAAPTAVH